MLAPLAQQNNLTPTTTTTATTTAGAASTCGNLIGNLPHTVTHTRPQYEQDELGGMLPKQTAVTAGIACWVQNASQREVLEFQKNDQEISHKVFFATKADIRPGDEITVTAGPSYVGLTLEHVSGPTDRSAGMGVLFAGFFIEDNNPRRT